MTSPDLFDAPQIAAPIPIAALNGRKSREILLEPDADQSAAIARHLNLSALRKFRFKGTLAPIGTQDWEISGLLGATVVQDCSVTLSPVTTRIDEPVLRRYVADWEEPQEAEAEMTIDDTQEPLGSKIDLSHMVLEALALALPDFPRAPGVAMTENGVLRAAPDGTEPLTDETVKPFAALAELRKKMTPPD